MKNRILLLAVALSFNAFAQDKSLSGTWREMSRIDNSGNKRSFGDTIKLNFLPGNEYTWMKKGGFIYRGSYKIEEGNLDLGMRYFTILHQNKEHIVLRDEEATYEFLPYTEPPQATLPAEAAPMAVTSMVQMDGDWTVFKRTADRTMQEIDYPNLIQSAVIKPTPEADGTFGYIAAGRQKDGSKKTWNITKFENGMLYTNGPSPRQFEVIKAEKELILKDDGITYFFKQF